MTEAVLALRERVSGWLGRPDADASKNPLRLRPAGGPDRLLCAVALILTAIGVVMVFSAGAALAARRHGDWTYFLKRESAYALFGLVAFALAVRTDYAFYRRWSYTLLFLTIAMLVAVLVVGTRVGGAVRWFRLGPLSFQPSELAKFSVALYLAVLLARKAEKVRAFSMGFLPPLLMSGLVVGLLILQPDLGTGVIIGVMALAMLFVAGTRASYIILAVLVAAPVGWKVFITGTAWRMRRMLAFLNPWEYCSAAGYQLCESLISVGSGGVFGQGLGASRQKLFFLPEAHTDFILAIIGEELGLVGVLAVLVGFGVMVWRGTLAGLRARDLFGSYLAFGITALFGLQALFNMAVVLGLLPTKGLALPFISYGGTSLVVSLFMAGVLANISARHPEPRPAPLFGAFRRRVTAGKNRRGSRGPQIIVEVRSPPPRRTPARPPMPPRATEAGTTTAGTTDARSTDAGASEAAPEGPPDEMPRDRGN
jgi:cell division protein FtsW